MSLLVTILIVILVLALLGSLPNWGWHGYGWQPSGVLLVIVVILLVLALTGRI